MTPQVPELIHEWAKAFNSRVKAAAAFKEAEAQEARVLSLLREAGIRVELLPPMAPDKPAIVGPVIVETAPVRAPASVRAPTPMQDDWRKRGLVPPPGKLSKNAYATRLGLKSNALSSHKEALDAAIDAEGWLDVAQADAILLERTKEDSILGKAVRVLQTPAVATEPEPPAPIAPVPESTPAAVILDQWPELSPLARMAVKAARFIRLRDSYTVEPVDPQNREGDWTIGSRIVTAVELIQEARRKGAPLPSPTEIAA